MCRDILDRSLDLVGQGYELEDVAFIYEDIAMLEHLRLLALSRGVPYTVLGGESEALGPGYPAHDRTAGDGREQPGPRCVPHGGFH